MVKRISPGAIHACVAVSVLLGTVALPTTAFAEGPSVTDRDADPVTPESDSDLPAGAHLEQRPKRWPLLVGALAFGAPYLSSVGVAAIDSERSPTVWLNIPVVGPWVFAGRWKGVAAPPQAIDDLNASLGTAFGRLLLVVDGTVQAAGLVFLSYGALSRENVIVDDVRTVRGGLHLIPVPALVGGVAPGAGVIATF